MLSRSQAPIIIDAPRENVKIIEPRPPPPPPSRSPEYRGPPYRQYQPKKFEVIGTISNDTEILPLYGRASQTRGDAWNYYTVTQGQQIYPLSITYNNKECQDQTVGCPEFYGNETGLTVTGKDGTYKINEIFGVREPTDEPYF